MNIIVVPGVHSSTLTQAFIQTMQPWLDRTWVVPNQDVPVYSPQHVLTFLKGKWEEMAFASSNAESITQSFLFIGFSAGVVGSFGAARQWKIQGGRVKGLIAFDGWGVPLYGPFPIHRVSHDAWTHWTSELLSQTQDSFYADPPVAHLDLWRSPHTASGVRTHSHRPNSHKPNSHRPNSHRSNSHRPNSHRSNSHRPNSHRSNSQQPETAATFVRSLLEHYRQQP